MVKDEDVKKMLKIFEEKKWEFELHMKSIVDILQMHPSLIINRRNVVHSLKSRIKSLESLTGKIHRKSARFLGGHEDFILKDMTDLCGVRALLLYSDDFKHVDAMVRSKIKSGDWFLNEKPKAYTWDPESREFFSNFDLDISEKPTSYTSVHYLIKPKEGSYICCELQVRTLFEEIWGEVDHQINYPSPTENIACREQIKVLSKIVGAGGRLLDSLLRVSTSGIEKQKDDG